MRQFNLQRPDLDPHLHLIEASAGTGKTYSIVGLFLHLLLSGRYSIDSILVVTFTNAATEELMHRIRSALTEAKDWFSAYLHGKKKSLENSRIDLNILHRYPAKESYLLLKQALSAFDQCRISTIHSFCRQLLQENAFECGIPFHSSFIESDIEILEIAAADFFRKYIVHEPLGAAIAYREKWAPDTIIGNYRASKRYPLTKVLPHGALENHGIVDEINELLIEASQVASDSPLIQNWHSDIFKKGKQPFCPDQDPQTLLSDLAQGDRTSFILFPLELTRENLMGSDPRKSILNRSKRFGKNYEPSMDPLVDTCDRFATAIEKYRQFLLSIFLSDVERRFEQEKKQEGVLAFDDLLQITYRALSHPTEGLKLVRAAQAKFNAALIDEFQDTDSIQYGIFKKLFTGRLWYIIGDPKQAIYGFRGADVYTYLRAKRDAQACQYTLDTNFRSSARLIQGINRLFQTEVTAQERTQTSFVTEGIDFQPARSPDEHIDSSKDRLQDQQHKPLTWWRFFVSKDSSGNVADRILAAIKAEILRLLHGEVLIDNRAVVPADIAVLVNSNYQAAIVQQALMDVGVPAVVGQTGDIFKTDEMGDLIKVLRAICRPNRDSWVRLALVTQIWSIDAASLYELNHNQLLWQALIDELNDYRRTWYKKGFMKMFEALFDNRRIGERWLAQERGERRLTNLLQAAELSQNRQLELHLNPERLIDLLTRERSREPKGIAEERELKLETDDQAVQVVTVHKSKGLQYEIVFCPFAWEGRTRVQEIPAVCHVGEDVICDFGSEQIAEHQRIAESERLAEDVRKLYVAVTRAKQRCYLVWGYADHQRQKNSVLLSSLTHLLMLHDSANRQESSDRILSTYHCIEKLALKFPELMCVCDLVDTGNVSGSMISHRHALLTKPRENRLTSEQLETWQISSFSHMIKNIQSEFPDHDESQQRGHTSHGSDAQGEPPESPVLVSSARTGRCLHEIFEQADFATIDDPCLADLVEQKLVQYRIMDRRPDKKNSLVDPIEHVVNMVRSVIHTDLKLDEASVLHLDRVTLSERLTEWMFHISVTSVVPTDLRNILAAHARGWVRDSYAPLLSQLSTQRIFGYLKGYVDLVCQQDGRFYIIDWKSNFLGNHPSQYTIQFLCQAMAEHHYVLQYHLYLLSLHRYLSLHKPDYDYDKDIGGVAYAFIRGVENQRDSTKGWYFDRPPLSLIQALDALFTTG